MATNKKKIFITESMSQQGRALLNARDDIVGVYFGRNGAQHGFLLHKSVFTTVVDPKGSPTIPYAIDDKGDIVGGYGGVGFPDQTDHTFLYELAK